MRKFKCTICGYICESEDFPTEPCPICFADPDVYEEIIEDEESVDL